MHEFPYCRYQVENIGFSTRHDRYGLTVNFRRDTKVTESHLTVEPLMMLSRIGGIIGVGQALVWVVDYVIENIIYFLQSCLKK